MAIRDTAPIRRHVGASPSSWLFGLTVFLSAFLLFQIQPLVGRMILPLYGGAASVWTVCMLFFQAVLLVGYVYAHWLASRRDPRPQTVVHLVLILVALLALGPGLRLGTVNEPSGDPSVSVLLTLCGLIGVPYLMLCTTGPLLAAWYAADTGRAPYRLFALSNLASMLALIGYPTLVEPNLALATQGRLWTTGFWLFCGLIAVLALRNAMRSAAESKSRVSDVRESWRMPFTWMSLAFVPSLLLLAITRYVSDDVAAIPLLWILFLSIYLLSFILCFESDRWYRRSVFIPLLLVTLILSGYELVSREHLMGLRASIASFGALLFCAAIVCHGELALRRPRDGNVTGFYLWVSVGGLLGGVFCATVAPALFNDYYELPLAMTLCLAIAVRQVWTATRSRVGWSGTAVRYACLAGAVAAVSTLGYRSYTHNQQYTELRRNFYGRLAVDDDVDGTRTLSHGSIVHGMQLRSEAGRTRATTYYTSGSGVGKAILASRHAGAAQSVGVIGLGAGTLAVYARPGDRYRFYDIDELVVEIARRDFSFLRDSPGKVDVVLGDARRRLQAEPGNNFDVLVVDAFSGDSIPIHLLTREAFDLYLRHLGRDGILAVHISNQYLDLEDVIAEHAAGMQLRALVFDIEDDEADLQYGSKWVLLARSQEVLAASGFRGGIPANTKPGAKEWTDDYSSVFAVLE